MYMTDGLYIRSGNKSDLDDIYALYRSLMDMPYSTWDEDYPSKEIVKEDLEKNEVLVMCENDGRIVSAIVIEDEQEEYDADAEWYPDVIKWAALARLGVSKDMQGHGIAKRMLCAAMKRAQESGCDGVRFLVSKDNPYPQRAYAKLNFDICGEVELFGLSWLCYQKRLSSCSFE